MKNRTKVLWTEKAEFPIGWGIKKHSHDYYHLFYIVEGNGSFIIHEQVFDAKPDLCYIIPPGVPHELEKVKDNTLKSYEIKFLIHDEDIVKHLNLETPQFVGDEFFRSIIPSIVANGRSKDSYYIRNTDAFLCSLLVHIANKNDVEEAPNSELIDTAGFHKITIKAIDFIEQQYMKRIYLDDVADHVGYNRNYLCSLFKKDTDITIIDYLNYVRIRKACEYIVYSDIDMNRICYRVGFTNPNHFNRTFKKFVGLPPTVFSKLHPFDINDDNDSVDSTLNKQLLTIPEALKTLNQTNE